MGNAKSFWISIVITAIIFLIIGFGIKVTDKINEKEYSLKTVTVYDYNGNIIDTYEGAYRVSQNKNGVFFKIYGKEVAIYNGIVITKEE